MHKPKYVKAQPVILPAAVFDALEMSYLVHKGGYGGTYSAINSGLAETLGIPPELCSTHLPCCLVGHARFLDGTLPNEYGHHHMRQGAPGTIEFALQRAFNKRVEPGNGKTCAEGENDDAIDRLEERTADSLRKRGKAPIYYPDFRVGFKRLAREMNMVRGAK